MNNLKRYPKVVCVLALYLQKDVGSLIIELLLKILLFLRLEKGEMELYTIVMVRPCRGFGGLFPLNTAISRHACC